MSTTTPGYTIVKGTAVFDELEKYRLCFERNGTERDMKNLEWLHHQNLVHNNVIYYAMQGDQIAAIYTALPLQFKINDTISPALQSIDTLTDIDHRGKGLFIKLASQLYNEAPGNGFTLAYGFPNDNSAPGFFKKLKWVSFGEAPFLIKPLSISYFFKKILNRKKHTDFSSSNHVYDAPQQIKLNADTTIKQINRFENDYDELWNSASVAVTVGVNRNAEYMNWRFVNKPAEHYYRYGLFKNGKISAVVVYSIKHKHDGLIGYIMELIILPGDTQSGKQLLKFLKKQFKKQSTDVVLTWCLPGSFNYAAYKKSGYYPLPEKLRPQQLFLGVRAFNESTRTVIENVKNWYISYADSDTA